MEKRIYWINFINETDNLGCCLVDVTSEEAASPLVDEDIKYNGTSGHSLDDARWLSAVSFKMLQFPNVPTRECQMAALRVDHLKSFEKAFGHFPRNKMLTAEDTSSLGCSTYETRLHGSKVLSMKEVSNNSACD